MTMQFNVVQPEVRGPDGRDAVFSRYIGNDCAQPAVFDLDGVRITFSPIHSSYASSGCTVDVVGGSREGRYEFSPHGDHIPAIVVGQTADQWEAGIMPSPIDDLLAHCDDRTLVSSSSNETAVLAQLSPPPRNAA